MDRIELKAITEEYREQILAYKEEFLANGDSLDGTAGLAKDWSFEEWITAVRDNAVETTVRPGLVPATTFLGIRTGDGRLIGMIDVRHRLNDYLLQFGGNIGYSVRKSERRKGYASGMLRLVLDECRKLGLDKVLLTCDKENAASRKTIVRNGGVFENEVPEGDRTTERYWISLI